MSEQVKRVITAVVLIPIALGLTWLSGWYFVAGIIILSSLAVLEACKIARRNGVHAMPIPLAIANIAIQVLVHLRFFIYVALVLFLLLVFMYVFEFFKGRPEGSLQRIGVSFFIAVIGLLFAFFTLTEFLALDPATGKYAGYRFVATLLVCIWAFDSFSYFGGRLLGRHPMAPSISPGKTWEGFIIGAIFGIIGFVVSGLYFLKPFPQMTLTNMIICAVAIVFAGIIGDLGESLIKRDAKMKDSGSLVVGHGGVLDRLDSLLIAAPAFYFILSLMVP